jgi:hypothetical protein
MNDIERARLSAFIAEKLVDRWHGLEVVRGISGLKAATEDFLNSLAGTSPARSVSGHIDDDGTFHWIGSVDRITAQRLLDSGAFVESDGNLVRKSFLDELQQ